MSDTGIIIQPELCTGCDRCASACRDEHFVPFDISLIQVQKSPVATGETRRSSPDMCRHCAHPACAAVCGEGAFEIDGCGAVRIVDEKCTGCGVCVDACPYDALHITTPKASFSVSLWMTLREKELLRRWKDRAARSVPAKCDLCRERQAAGRPAACVFACPTGALRSDAGNSRPEEFAVRYVCGGKDLGDVRNVRSMLKDRSARDDDSE